MRRLPVHQSLGNLYEDVQRNDSAGVIPRITIPVDFCMSIMYVTRLSYDTYICNCKFVFCCAVCERLYEQRVSLSIAALTLCNRKKKKKKTLERMAARNETIERRSATLVYDMITIIRLIAIS